MVRSAHVTSLDAVRAFKNDLVAFQTALRQQLEHMTEEMRRGVQWLESDRAAYWPAQVRKASDAVAEARINLERCRLAAGTDEHRSCYDETKALDRAKYRLAYAEQQVRTTRKWIRIVQREADEFQTRLAKLGDISERDLPAAIALLDRLARALDTYAGRGVRPSAPSEDFDGVGPSRGEASEPSESDSPPSPGDRQP